ncbi:hypothetical protein [Actinophytocola glycyrrhizae]|uniref:Aminoglycoside phosphotransferase domain-containing protein n=1 Tax=Actinophytocola glycyrrhizae TaxID=2044873 RepID=A0ABV9S4Y7_9PSEU
MARLEPGFKVKQILGPLDGVSRTGPLLWTVQALLKEEVGPETYDLANEYICARLAAIIGLPSPPGDFATRYDSTEKYWVTPLVMRESPPPADTEKICAEEPKFTAGTLVFDTWILNDDRHEDNIIYSSTVGLWLIDHASALCPKGENPKEIIEQCVQQTLSNHIFSHHVNRDDVSHWCGRVRGVQPQAIRAAIWPTVKYEIISKEHAGALQTFLCERAQVITRLVSALMRFKEDAKTAGETSEENIS